MASSTLIPKFVKYLCADDCISDEMRVPRLFSNNYRLRVSNIWLIRFRNGYKMAIGYDSEKSIVFGISDFVADFGLKGGEVLVFENVDRSNFNVFIIGLDGCEMKYPAIVHSTQSTLPIEVRSIDGGWRFLKFFSYADFASHTINEIDVPKSFVLEVHGRMPSSVKYVLNCAASFSGYFDEFSRKLFGFRSLCEWLHLSNFTAMDCVLFTYDMGRNLKLSYFDGRQVEILFDNALIASGNLCFTLRSPSHFSIELKPFHMLPYSYGVDISVDYFRVSVFWKKKEMITVYDGSRSWVLEVRKRATGKRSTINGGWIKFRDDLQLTVGDKCWFVWFDESYNHFRIELERAVIEID